VKKADLVIAAHESIRSYLQPHAKADVLVVANYVDLPEKVPEKREKAQGEPLVLFYGGALEPTRCIGELIDAVKKLDGCVLRIAGAGRLEEKVKRAADGKIIYLGFLPHDILMKETAACDAVLSLFDVRIENNRIGTPTKLPEAMSVATPIITSAGTNAADIVVREGCGIAIKWSEESFKEAVEQLRDPQLRHKLGEAGRRAAEREYNWAFMKRRLLESYRSLRAVLSPQL
jgi:glycosyltransferase involved in cell wall biosynthesis